MRTHRDGYLQCNKLEVTVPAAVYRQAINASDFMVTGLLEQIGKEINVEITGQITCRVLRYTDYDAKVVLQLTDQWVQPSKG